MAKHNYYPKELKIQIVARLLAGESVTALQKEFHIPSNGTIYTWKKWYLSHDFRRLESTFQTSSKNKIIIRTGIGK